METVLSSFLEHLHKLLGRSLHSVFLYGSCVMNDFQPGWSDIDVLCFTSSPISDEEAKALLHLRQNLNEESKNPLFRSIEGAVVCTDEFIKNQYTNVVYWGTRGERIKSSYELDVFSRFSLLHFGQCLYGSRPATDFLSDVSFSQLVEGIQNHLSIIRIHAQCTDDRLYSCGWLLDIARCLYTLRNKTIISKTEAAKWALSQRLCPEPSQMEQTLSIRQNPSESLKSPFVRSWLRTLGPSVQKFADVLEKELLSVEAIQK